MTVLRHASSAHHRLALAGQSLFAVLTALALATVPVFAQGPPNGLPAQASPVAEVQVEGELDVMYEDTPTGARLLHFLKVADQRLRLIFEGDLPPGLSTGSQVRVRGRLQNDVLELSGGGSSVQTVALASPNTFGEQRTLVMLVNFQDNLSQPYSVAAAHTTTFQDVSKFFIENSYGQTWLTGDAVGWLTLPMTSSTCDYYKISSLAEQAATSQGINLSQYPRRVFAFPKMSACSWWGLGNVGGNPSRSWVNGNYALKVVAHELGHNFGVHHSRAASCDTAGCTTSEYGDTHDVMGNPTGHMNAFQKERIGWLNYGESPSTQTVTASGSYWIDTMSTTPGSAPKALRILKSTDSNGYRTWYYVETRARLGFDAGLTPGVIVHTGSDSTVNSSLQLDMTPLASGFDAVLDPGQTFTDAAIGLTISTSGVNQSGASVFIEHPGVPCTSRAPSVSLSPGSVMLSAGQSTTLMFTVRNNDDAGCVATDFQVSASAPTGWGASTGVTRLVVAPGATASTPVAVVPATGASGASTVSSAVTRANSSQPGGSASATVTVASALDVTLSVAGGSRGYDFTTVVRAGGAPVSGVTAAFVLTSPTGATVRLSVTTDGSGVATARWKPRPKDARGSYGVVVSAASGGLTGTASGSFVH
jgi:hypothetical protein